LLNSHQITNAFYINPKNREVVMSKTKRFMMSLLLLQAFICPLTAHAGGFLKDPKVLRWEAFTYSLEALTAPNTRRGILYITELGNTGVIPFMPFAALADAVLFLVIGVPGTLFNGLGVLGDQVSS
jgi:hypothetical protein